MEVFPKLAKNRPIATMEKVPEHLIGINENSSNQKLV